MGLLDLLFGNTKSDQVTAPSHPAATINKEKRKEKPTQAKRRIVVEKPHLKVTEPQKLKKQ